MSEHKKGLRPIHAPSSVTIGEAWNLYFGEKYASEDLLRLSLSLLDSICFGDAIAIKFEGDLQDTMRTFIASNFHDKHVPREALDKELKISEPFLRKPYIVLLKFAIWLYEKYILETEVKEKALLEQVIKGLKVTPGTIYFVPKDRAFRSTILFPSLNMFISLWLEKEDHRKMLESLLNGIYNLWKSVRKASKERRRKIDNYFKIMANNLNILCKDLIETAIINYSALRNILDITLEISLNYNIPVWFDSYGKLVS